MQILLRVEMIEQLAIGMLNGSIVSCIAESSEEDERLCSIALAKLKHGREDR